jgi:hypothetical protein
LLFLFAESIAMYEFQLPQKGCFATVASPQYQHLRSILQCFSFLFNLLVNLP